MASSSFGQTPPFFENVAVAGGGDGGRLLPGIWPSGFEPWPSGNHSTVAQQCGQQWKEAGGWSSGQWQGPISHQQRDQMAKEKCKYFMVGKCKKADSCPFSHDFRPEKKAELCKYYAQSSGCQKGGSCIFMHGEWPCKFFHLYKSCNMATGDCKFSHKPITQEMAAMLQRIQDETNQPKVPPPMSEAIRYHRQQSTPDSSSRGSKNKSEGNNDSNSNNNRDDSREDSHGSSHGRAPDSAAQRQYTPRPYADLYAAQWSQYNSQLEAGQWSRPADHDSHSDSNPRRLPTALLAQRRRSRSPNRGEPDEADWKLRGRRQQGAGRSNCVREGARRSSRSRTSGRH